MAKKNPITPNSQITNILRRLWMYSRERRARLWVDDSICWTCKRKGSKAKGREVAVEVHHVEPVRMNLIIEVIRRELLVGPEKLATFCRECHKAEHKTTEELKDRPRRGLGSPGLD